MKIKLLLAGAVTALGGLALASTGDGLRPYSQAAREAWASVKGSTGGARLLSDPIATGGVLVNNAAETPVVGLLPLADLTGAVVWGNAAGVTNEVGIKGAAGVSSLGAGFLAVRNTSNTTTFMLDGNSGLISFAGDVAEAFPSVGAEAVPGSVLVIAAGSPGAVTLSTRPYDRRVAGIAAGRDDYRPGITLRGLAPLPGAVAVTLAGTAYCRVSDENGPIRAGDLLTTSSLPGHAMRALDPARAQGAILGKALEDFMGERGRILVLASLQ